MPEMVAPRALDFCRKPEGSWALGTRMESNKKCEQTLESARYELEIIFDFAKFGKIVFCVVSHDFRDLNRQIRKKGH